MFRIGYLAVCAMCVGLFAFTIGTSAETWYYGPLLTTSFLLAGGSFVGFFLSFFLERTSSDTYRVSRAGWAKLFFPLAYYEKETRVCYLVWDGMSLFIAIMGIIALCLTIFVLITNDPSLKTTGPLGFVGLLGALLFALFTPVIVSFLAKYLTAGECPPILLRVGIAIVVILCTLVSKFLLTLLFFFLFLVVAVIGSILFKKGCPTIRRD